MAIIGFVILAAAAVFGIEIVAVNNVSINVDAFNQGYDTSVALVFVAGAVTGLAGAFGLMLMRDGLVRLRRLRLEAREAEELRERHIAELEEEHAAMLRNARAEADGVDLRERSHDQDHVTTF